MAAFSGHREDGDELLGCCFSVAYSHVEERWWEKRGEDEFPLLSFLKAWLLALPLQFRDVLSSCASSVIAVPLKPDETKCVSPCPGVTGVTLCSFPHLPSLHPSPLHSRPRPLELPFAPGKLFPCGQERMRLPLLPLTSFSSFAFKLLLATAFTDIWRVGNGEIGRGRGWGMERGF